MGNLTTMLEGVAQAWMAAMLSSAWQGVVITVFVALVLGQWRRSNAATRFTVWGATLGVMALLPLLNLGAPRLIPAEAWGELAKLLAQAGAVLVESGPAAEAATGRQVGAAAAELINSGAPSVPGLQGGWAILALVVWLVACLRLLFGLGTGYLRTVALCRGSLGLAPRYQHRLNLLAARLELRQRVRVRGSREVASPVVVGLRHHVILLPAQVAGDLTSEELDQVLMHEIAHLRRGDSWWKLAQGVLAAIGCFLPAVWWVCRRMDLEREVACDDWVVIATGRRRAYANCLMRLVQLGAWSRAPALASGAANGRSQFGRRIFLLLDRKRNRDIRSCRAGGAALAGLGGLLALVLAACANPFAPPRHKPVEPGYGDPAPLATTPEILIDNLHRAMRDRDKDLYEELIDPDFWFTELDCRGDLVLANGREEELEIMGSRDGSHNGILDIFETFEFHFDIAANGRTTELARDYPDAFPGDPDGHPKEDWEVFRGRTEMLMLDHDGDGFRVNQVMTYKLRKSEEGVWRMIRWADDPLSGDCGSPALSAAAGGSGWRG